MRIKLLLLIFTFFTIGFSSYAQFNKEFEFKYTKAVNYTFQEKFADALPIFLKLDSLVPNNPNINFYIGFCYINIAKEKVKAIPYLEKAIVNISLDYVGNYNETSSPIYSLLYIAKAYHLADRLDDEMVSLNSFRYYSKRSLMGEINEILF